MSIFRASLLAAFTACVPVSAFSDGLSLTIRAPLPKMENPLPSLPATPAGLRLLPLTALPADEGSLRPIIVKQTVLNAFGLPCGETLRVTAGAAALLKVEITAPCRPHAAVTIEHAGLRFEDALSYAGVLEFVIPALEESGTVTARLGQDTALTQADPVEDLSQFTRIAIGWDAGHAMEILADAPAHLPVTVLRFGPNKDLHILSHHRDPGHKPGVIRLALARMIEVETCASGAEGSVLKLLPDLPPQRYKLKLAAPGCAHLGEMFLLKNILQDLKLAER
ncbi:MAG: hypothetical protein AAF700_04360 [Pseudomonadota bacterium]